MFITACSNAEEVEIDNDLSEFEKEENEQVINEEGEGGKSDDQIKKEGYISTTTGLNLGDKEENQHFAVMIENSPNARPQTGLIDADIVFEMEAEGGVSRYMALYHDKIPEKIGPVRSARHFYVELANDLNAPFIHYGGIPQAHEAIRNSDIQTLDGQNGGSQFIRDHTRVAPHNAYVQTEGLPNYSENQLHSFFAFEENIEIENQAKEVELYYNSYTNIKYLWDEERELYIRFQEGTEHIDRETNEIIHIKNIVIQGAHHSPLPNAKNGRIDIDFEGKGEVIIVYNGIQKKGYWTNIDGKITYFEEDGSPLKLTKGNTWVQIVDNFSSIKINN